MAASAASYEHKTVELEPLNFDRFCSEVAAQLATSTWKSRLAKTVKLVPSHCSHDNDVIVVPVELTTDIDLVVVISSLCAWNASAHCGTTFESVAHEVTFAIPRIDLKGMPCLIQLRCETPPGTLVDGAVNYRFSLRVAATRQVACAGTVKCVANVG